jgi:hypothetical protein
MWEGVGNHAVRLKLLNWMTSNVTSAYSNDKVTPISMNSKIMLVFPIGCQLFSA